MRNILSSKLLSALLCLCLLAGVIPVSSTAEGEPVTLTFWHSASREDKALIEQYTADFNATIGAEMGVRVEAVFQGSYSDAVTKMNSILSVPGNTDELPDIMQMDATGKTAYSQAETAWTVDDMLAEYPETDLSAMLPIAMKNWNLAGVQLGLPFATSTTVTYYNKSVLGDLPLDTLQDVAALSGTIAETAEDGAPITIYASIPNTPSLSNWLGQLGSDLVNMENGTRGTADGLACVENGALVSFLTAWKELYASGALENVSSNNESFAAGRLLIMTASSSSEAGIQAQIGDRFELGVRPYLRVNNEAHSGASVNGSCLVLFDHGETRRAAARAFALYLTSADIQTSFAIGTGYMPSNLLSIESESWKFFVSEHPNYGVALEQALNAPENMRSVTVGPSADFYYTIMNDIFDMLENDQSPEETAEIMRDDLEGLLTQYARANP